MSKKTFQNHRLRELDGWLNLKDYITEIENKQAVVCENFNFDWNKLVSSKWILEKHNVWWPTQWITVDSDDVWSVHWWWIWKNWVSELAAHTYTMSLPSDPTWKVFAISFNWDIKVFGDITWWYNQITTELNTFFDATYNTVTNTLWDYTIAKADWSWIAIANENLVRTISLNWWDSFSKITITIDWNSTTVDWWIYSTADLALAQVISQLPASTYYTTTPSWGSFNIVRQDAAIPVITSVEFDRYTYRVQYEYDDTPFPWQLWDETRTTVDGLTITTPWSGSRAFFWHEIVTKISWLETQVWTFAGNFTTANDWRGIKVLNKTASQLQEVKCESSVSSVRVLSEDWLTTLDTQTPVAWVATFSLALAANTTYRIECQITDWDSNTYNYTSQVVPSDMFDVTWGSANWWGTSLPNYAVSELTIDGTFFPVATYDTSFVINPAFQTSSYMDIYKQDYSTMVISSLNSYTNPFSFPDDSILTTITETNHLASISVAIYTGYQQTNVDNGWQLDPFERYQITIHQYWWLFVWTNFNPVIISTAWVPTSLPIITVWQPTVWTIYQWRTVLWWYGNDNILYSRIASANNPQYIADFTTFESSTQTVSWWNKNNITGFLVWENWLYVFKDNQVWYTNSEDTDNSTYFRFVFKKIADFWALNQNCITDIGQDILYYDHKTRAVRRLGYEKDLTTLRDRKISKEIDSILQSIPVDDEVNDERYSQLINSSFKYPLYKLHITSSTSPYVYFQVGNEDQKFRLPNITLTYNVENKSWATETIKDNIWQYPTCSFKWFFWSENGRIYEDDIWNTTEAWTFKWKLHTFWDDVDVKKIWELECSWRIEPEAWQTKTVTITPISHNSDDTTTDWVELTDYTETVSATTNTDFRTRANMYEFARGLQHKITHSWNGYCEIASLNTQVKPTTL